MIFTCTRQMLINDDMDAFARLPQLHGKAARRLENVVAWNPIITAELGETMSDSVTLFHAATHSNYTASGGAITVANLAVGELAVRTQTGLTDAGLDLNPSTLVVPAALSVSARQLIGSAADPAIANSRVINPFEGLYEVLTNRLLDGLTNGATAWYLFCDPDQIDTIEVAFLEGNETPFLETQMGFEIDGIKNKVRHECASKAIDWRGMYKNKGA